MINFSNRSYQKELLDGNGIPFSDIKQNMKELNRINTLLGGHAISIMGIKEILKTIPLKKSGEPFLVCEIGCGGGDNIRAINKWCKRKGIQVSFVGVDMKKECIEFAEQQCDGIKAEWIVSPFQLVQFQQKPDIIFSSLFCHHLNDEELHNMFQWLKNNANTAFFINDLHRHFIAYYSIKILTKLFSKSYLVKNDAPLSVTRGFLKKEWEQFIQKSGIQKYSVRWKWAFRHLIIVTKNEQSSF